MPGFWKKSKAKRAEAGTEQTPPQPAPLHLREAGGRLAPEEKPAVPAKPDPNSKLPLRTPKKTKLHLMTGREESERSFQAAREHFLSKNLPTILNKEVVQKERSHTVEFFMDRLIAIIGFFLILVGWMWLYHHGQDIENWWKALLDSIKVI